jgi:hypothetical protein
LPTLVGKQNCIGKGVSYVIAQSRFSQGKFPPVPTSATLRQIQRKRPLNDEALLEVGRLGKPNTESCQAMQVREVYAYRQTAQQARPVAGVELEDLDLLAFFVIPQIYVGQAAPP